MRIGVTSEADARARFGEPESEPDPAPLTSGELALGGSLFVILAAGVCAALFWLLGKALAP